jgi:predicted CXXCH cytochrome family protein
VRLEQVDERIVATLLDEDGQPAYSRPLGLLTGSHHFENYWMVEDSGWFVQFPFLWDLRRERWIPTADSFLRPDHATPRPPAVWNTNCAYCHTVNPASRVSADLKQADSQVAELGIACEACHGPGQAHVAAQRDPIQRYRAHLSDAADPHVRQPQRMDKTRASMVCGQCHGVSLVADWASRQRDGDRFRPGDDLSPTRLLLLPQPRPDGRPGLMIPARPAPAAAQLGEAEVQIVGLRADEIFLTGTVRRNVGPLVVGDLRLDGIARPYPGGGTFRVLRASQRTVEQLARALGWPSRLPTEEDLSAFWDDGTVRTAGREYNGLAVSPCFTRGEMQCGTCHQMHGAPPDDMLTPEGAGDGACMQCHADVDAVAHSHHPAGSSGTRCQNCHQPHTTFGLLGGIRSHRIDNPSVQTSTRFGRPNACNLCHLDRSLGWAADALARWYGQPRPALQPDQERVAAGLLWILNGNAAQRGIAAWSFGWAPAQAVAGTDWMAPHLIRLLDDDYAAVRSVAGDVLHALPPFADLGYDFVASPPVRRARQAEAARRLTTQRTDPTLLLDTGRPTAVADRLWHTRDRRPVSISE